MIALMSQTKLPDSSNPLSDIVGAVHRELKQANEIIKKAAAFFAQAELDRPPR